MKKAIVLGLLCVGAFAVLGSSEYKANQTDGNFRTEVCQVDGRFVFRSDGEVYSFTEDHGNRKMIVTFDTKGTDNPTDDVIVDAVAYIA